jgi:hypothetical protein
VACRRDASRSVAGMAARRGRRRCAAAGTMLILKTAYAPTHCSQPRSLRCRRQKSGGNRGTVHRGQDQSWRPLTSRQVRASGRNGRRPWKLRSLVLFSSSRTGCSQRQHVVSTTGSEF